MWYLFCLFHGCSAGSSGDIGQNQVELYSSFLPDTFLKIYHFPFDLILFSSASKSKQAFMDYLVHLPCFRNVTWHVLSWASSVNSCVCSSWSSPCNHALWIYTTLYRSIHKQTNKPSFTFKCRASCISSWEVARSAESRPKLLVPEGDSCGTTPAKRYPWKKIRNGKLNQDSRSRSPWNLECQVSLDSFRVWTTWPSSMCCPPVKWCNRMHIYVAFGCLRF